MPGTSSVSLLTPSFQVRIDATPLPLLVEVAIAHITVDEDTRLPSMFVLDITPTEQQDSDTEWIDDPNLFAIGKSVQIQLGYIEDLAPIMTGEITALEPEFATHQLPRLTVRGYDRRHRLQRGRKTRTFVQQKDSDIAAQIASEAGLTAETEDTQVVHDYVMQAEQTDMEFLLDRASRIHYEVIVEDKVLRFRPVANAESEQVTLSLADDLLEFLPRLSSIGQISEVNVRSWNPKEKETIVAQATASDAVSTMGGASSAATTVQSAFGSAIAPISTPVMTQAEADQQAKAHLNQRVLDWIVGEGMCRGRTDVRAGTVIKLDGLGQRFSGQYYVTRARHCYSSNGYYTHFTVRRNAS